MYDSNDNFVHPAAAICTIDSPVGILLAGASARALLALEFTEVDTLAQQRDRLSARLAAPLNPEHPVLAQLQQELERYFNGQLQHFDLPLDYSGSAFQHRVWKLLLQIPYGVTCSYRDVAHRLGDPKALRAVGGANHLNPIAILIPCHRVINASGALGGYGGGQWRKQVLLDLEAGQQRLAL